MAVGWSSVLGTAGIAAIALTKCWKYWIDFRRDKYRMDWYMRDLKRLVKLGILTPAQLERLGAVSVEYLSRLSERDPTVFSAVLRGHIDVQQREFPPAA